MPAPNRQSSFELRASLVAFDATCRNLHPMLIDFVAESLRDRGVRSRIEHSPDSDPEASLPSDRAPAVAPRQLTGATRSGKASYATEGGVYRNAGLPANPVGPGDGDRHANRTNSRPGPGSPPATTFSVACDYPRWREQ